MSASKLSTNANALSLSQSDWCQRSNIGLWLQGFALHRSDALMLAVYPEIVFYLEITFIQLTLWQDQTTLTWEIWNSSCKGLENLMGDSNEMIFTELISSMCPVDGLCMVHLQDLLLGSFVHEGQLVFSIFCRFT